MRFIYDNIVVIAVAAVACGFTWLYGGIVADALLPIMPWLYAFMLEMMLCFPQRRKTETLNDARERVWTQMRKDPVFWIVVGFFVLLMIPFVNKGLCPICDFPAIEYEGARARPPIPFIPFCVNRLNHLNVVMWFVPALTALLAVRHALTRKGKRLIISMVVWNGLLLALIGAIQQVTDAPGPLWQSLGDEGKVYFFSTFGYPNMGGDYFTTLFALAIALWRWNVEEVRTNREENLSRGEVHKKDVAFWKSHFMLVPAIVFYFCALTTLSRAAILLATSIAIIAFIHGFLSFFKRMGKVRRVKLTAVWFVSFVILAFCAKVFIPQDIQKEVDTLDTIEMLDRVSGREQYHVRVATEIWKENFLCGCGGWGYKHFCIPKMTEDEMKKIQNVGGINVHNDYLQFLAEHGTIGFACLVAIVILLIWPLGAIWRGLLRVASFTPVKQQPPKPIAIFVLPAPIFFILLSALATFIHGFADCPFRSPAVLTLFFVSLASLEGFLTLHQKNSAKDAIKKISHKESHSQKK